MAERDRAPRDEQQEGGFLRRWSRRKAETRHAERQNVAPPDPQSEAASEPARPAAPETIDPKDLPDIDSLNAESDFTVFMRAGVPEELRRQALRKLWRSSPTLANLDGLLEYGEDYTQVGRGGMSIKTAYQVGKGFVRQVEEAAAGELPQQPDTPARPVAGEGHKLEPPADAPAPPADANASPAPKSEADRRTADAAPSPGPAHEAERTAEAATTEVPAADQFSVRPRPRRKLPKRG